ncbi:M48 family metallopeptidase [Minwuia thermotolerans]|uniref:Peptidase M48 domain-containing protein n=1 Tax=Minwuia thermotolerans TaxID=2056226 RepID=A0A2M9G1H5_9PROT|nr:M48 family metallopeptidase [Minwuia thermotolerans]PJK29549.1 hypothetical protein CVT23_10835 [Minwuia thermotolerans]
MEAPWNRSRATFSDGRTAAIHDVEVDIAPEGIGIEGDDVSVHWGEAGLEVVDAPANAKALRLGHADHDGARLLLEGEALVAEVREALPGLLARRPDSRRYDLKKLGVWGGAVAALAALFFLFLPAIVSGVAALIPQSVEKRLGDQALAAFSQFFDGMENECREREGQQALDWMVVQIMDGARIERGADVRVVPVDMVNAVAFPGGRVLIFDGLIQQAESAEEVAGVVAHELGHVEYRHGMERMVRDSAISAVLSVFAPGAAGDIGSEFGGALLTQSYGRDAEREADAFAVETLNRIGVTTGGMASFFERMAQKHDAGQGGSLMQYLASHPAPTERAGTIAARGTGDERILSDAEWRALKAICPKD